MKKRKIKFDNSPRGPAVEFLGEGQQFVAAGSHSSGVRYQWSPGLPGSLPTLTLDQLNSIWETLTATYAVNGATPSSQTAAAKESRSETGSPSKESLGTTESSTLTMISESDWAQLISALRFLLDKVGDNDTWSEVGYALLSLQATRPIKQLWSDFSRKAVGYTEGADVAWWEAHCQQTPRSDYRHVFAMARERGMARVADPAAFPPVHDTGDSGGGDQAGAGPGDISVVPPPLPEKPLVQLAATNFSGVVTQLETILTPHVYTQGPHLVRPSAPVDDKTITRSADALMLIQVTKGWAKFRFDELATFQKSTVGGWVNTGPSVDHINTLLDLGGWTRLRPLDAIARSPFIRPDGSICDVPGYDSRTRVLYVPSASYPGIPADPGKDHAREGLERIRGVFDQFPWKEPASESAFLSHILTEAARLAVDRCPMYFYDAPVAGTGKGLLQEMAARIVHGSEPSIRAWVSDGDEIRKALSASMIAGDRSLWFDNVPSGNKVRSHELCTFITSEIWMDRRLGESEILSIPNKCVLVASGNNITPVGDMARRSLVVRMDANTEKLRERVFKIPEGQMRPYVMEHRPELLVHALTIIKAFHAAKDVPQMPVALPSFGRWSHFCRDPLIWLGLPDPVITQRETDDETKSLGPIFERMAAQFGDREFTCVDVARLVGGIADSNGELAAALQQNGCVEPNSPTKVGYWLRGCRDNIGGGWKLVHAGHSMHGAKWRFARTGELT